MQLRDVVVGQLVEITGGSTRDSFEPGNVGRRGTVKRVDFGACDDLSVQVLFDQEERSGGHDWGNHKDIELLGVKPAVSAKTEHQTRKERPACRGVLFYFPDAIAEVANISRIGNEQHNAGQPMHWAFGKSNDHGDCILRHQMDYDELDTDGLLHAGKVAWRALAQLQELLEKRDPTLHAQRQAQRDRQARGER